MLELRGAERRGNNFLDSQYFIHIGSHLYS